jgi:hypothetical protein
MSILVVVGILSGEILLRSAEMGTAKKLLPNIGLTSYGVQIFWLNFQNLRVKDWAVGALLKHVMATF